MKEGLPSSHLNAVGAGILLWGKGGYIEKYLCRLFDLQFLPQSNLFWPRLIIKMNACVTTEICLGDLRKREEGKKERKKTYMNNPFLVPITHTWIMGEPKFFPHGLHLLLSVDQDHAFPAFSSGKQSA